MTQALIRAINQGLYAAGWTVIHAGGPKDGSWAKVAAVVEAHIQRRIAKAVKAEREACIKVCDDLWQEDGGAYRCREAIRARGKT